MVNQHALTPAFHLISFQTFQRKATELLCLPHMDHRTATFSTLHSYPKPVLHPSTYGDSVLLSVQVSDAKFEPKHQVQPNEQWIQCHHQPSDFQMLSSQLGWLRCGSTGCIWGLNMDTGVQLICTTCIWGLSMDMRVDSGCTRCIWGLNLDVGLHGGALDMCGAESWMWGPRGHTGCTCASNLDMDHFPAIPMVTPSCACRGHPAAIPVVSPWG